MTTMRPIPVNRYLVPVQSSDPPADAVVVDATLINGLPFTVSLGSDFALVLTYATGLAKEWRAMDTQAVIADSSIEQEPRSEPTDPVTDPRTGRLTVALQRGGRTVAVLPVVSGRHRLVEPGNPAARRFDVWILGWDVRAGTIRGPGDFGSRLRLAWRRADTSIHSFAPVPVNPFVMLRLVPILVPMILTTASTDTPAERQLKIENQILFKKGKLIQWHY
jgi:hypothetical protein